MTRTLADMTPEERAACVGRWCETSPARGLGILTRIDDERQDCIVLAVDSGDSWLHDLAEVTPRFDLPRAWTPEGEPVPGEWEERAHQDGIGDRVWFTRQRRYITDWEEE